MDRDDLVDIMSTIGVDDIRHMKIEWQDDNYIREVQYHQIKKCKEDE